MNRNKGRWFLTKKYIFAGIVSLVLIYGLYTLWPVQSFIWPMVTGKTLFVMTNENEARPCGGFASVYGVVSVFPPRVELKNVYALKDTSFGASEYPLSLVSESNRFWDMGIDTDISVCAENFKQAYQFAREESIDQVLLVDFKTLEQVIQLFDSFTFQGQTFPSDKLFAVLSRSVANVDRHDEVSLETRKSPLADFGKTLIFRSILNPTKPPHITRILKKGRENGDVYFSGQEVPVIGTNDFAVVEWNLGGGKSSRYLHKQVSIEGREIQPNEWQWSFRLTADHKGGFDEPLSQYWKGVWEFHFPEWMGKSMKQIEAEMAPGERFQTGFIVDTTGPLPGEIGLFAPRGQSYDYDISVTVYPQQLIRGDLQNVEHVGMESGTIRSKKKTWNLVSQKDAWGPFVTIHTVVAPESLPSEIQGQFADSDMIIELHFNEAGQIQEDNFVLELKDGNYADTITNDPVLQEWVLMPDKVTLFAGFNVPQQVFEERYRLSIDGVFDQFGNRIQPGQRTLIDRVVGQAQ